MQNLENGLRGTEQETEKGPVRISKRFHPRHRHSKMLRQGGRREEKKKKSLRLSSEERFGVCYRKGWGWEKEKKGAYVESDPFGSSFFQRCR